MRKMMDRIYRIAGDFWLGLSIAAVGVAQVAVGLAAVGAFVGVLGAPIWWAMLGFYWLALVNFILWIAILLTIVGNEYRT